MRGEGDLTRRHVCCGTSRYPRVSGAKGKKVETSEATDGVATAVATKRKSQRRGNRTKLAEYSNTRKVERKDDTELANSGREKKKKKRTPLSLPACNVRSRSEMAPPRLLNMKHKGHHTMTAEKENAMTSETSPQC